MNDTDCRKCKTPMPMSMAAPLTSGPFAGRLFTLIGYLCAKCGHWNDLSRRKANKREAGES